VTTDFTVTPIVEERGGRTTVDMPSAVGGEPTRGDRIIRGVERAGVIAVGDLSVSWIFRGEPPSIGDIVKVRVPDWEPFEKLRHHCFDRTEGMVEVAPGGWSCECTPAADEVRKSNTRQIQIINSVRLAWIIYNHVVAIPASFALYIIAWLVQHPGRLLLSAILTLIVVGVVFK
jgi:hypothetical protein